MIYTNFYVTKGSAASNTNGGGPRLGTNDGPVVTVADASVISGAITTIVDNTGGNWAGVQVDDWISWNPSGSTYEYRRVTAIAPGGDATKITVHANTSVAANRTVKVGGAWATTAFGATTMTTSFINANSDPPKLWVKAGPYNEMVSCNAGASNCWLSYEGYTTTPGDNGVVEIYYACNNGQAVVAANAYTHFKNFYVRLASGGATGHLAVGAWSAYQKKTGPIIVENVKAKCDVGTGNGAFWVYDSYYIRFINCLVDGTTGMGFYFAYPWQYDYEFINCRFGGCANYGVYAYGANNGGAWTFLNCIFNNNYDDHIHLCNCEFATVMNCTFYASTVGSGINTNGANVSYRNSIRNCLFVSNNQYGIEAVNNSTFIYCENNAFYNNGQGNYQAATRIRTVPGTSEIILTGDPFTNAAGKDFSLNNTAGRGAACRNVASPVTLLDGVNKTYVDIGALRHQDPEGGSVGEVAYSWLS